MMTPRTGGGNGPDTPFFIELQTSVLHKEIKEEKK
jgi:hypothetical protein